jgi:itaconyl-CoA hydratase
MSADQPGSSHPERIEAHAPKVPVWHGRFFEDFEIGDHFQHQLGRTILAADNAWFTLLTMNTNELHFNDHYSQASAMGKQLVNSGLTVAMLLGLSVQDISQNAVANLGWTDIKLTHPFFVDDTMYGESVVEGLRLSNSRPHAGVVSVRTRGLNQHGDECLSFKRSVMVHTKDSPQAKSVFPQGKKPF